MASRSNHRQPSLKRLSRPVVGPQDRKGGEPDNKRSKKHKGKQSKAKTQASANVAEADASARPWDSILKRINYRLSSLSYALLSVQALEAERKGWGAGSAAAEASSAELRPSVSSKVAIRDARAAVSRHRAELVVLLEQLVATGDAFEPCDPYATRAAGEEAEGDARSSTSGGGTQSTSGSNGCSTSDGAAPASSSSSSSSSSSASSALSDDEKSWEAFCAVCGSEDDTADNPILLCDINGCGRAFHRLCCQQPLPLSDLEDEDDAWACDYCCCLGDSLVAVGEVDSDMDRDSVPELIEALKLSVALFEAESGKEKAEGGANSEEKQAQAEAEAVAAAAQEVAAGEDGAEAGGSRRRNAVSYAKLVKEQSEFLDQYDEEDDEDFDMSSDALARRDREDRRAEAAMLGTKPRSSDESSEDDDADEDDDEDEDDEDDEGMGSSGLLVQRPRRRAAEDARPRILEELQAAKAHPPARDGATHDEESEGDSSFDEEEEADASDSDEGASRSSAEEHG